MRLRILVLGLLTAGCSPEQPAESVPPVSDARAVPEAARPDSLPSTVAETRAVILAAAAREDWAALDSLAAWTPGPGQSPFLYTLGPTFGPPSIFWRTHGGEGFLDEMTAVLQSTPQLSDGGGRLAGVGVDPAHGLIARRPRLVRGRRTRPVSGLHGRGRLRRPRHVYRLDRALATLRRWGVGATRRSSRAGCRRESAASWPGAAPRPTAR